MADYTKYTKQEMQAYAIAKNIKEKNAALPGRGGRRPLKHCFMRNA